MAALDRMLGGGVVGKPQPATDSGVQSLIPGTTEQPPRTLTERAPPLSVDPMGLPRRDPTEI
ncbi:hypothetical protein, partial [Mycobacterium sp. NPDC004974]